jgi:hypothetical protein
VYREKGVDPLDMAYCDAWLFNTVARGIKPIAVAGSG